MAPLRFVSIAIATGGRRGENPLATVVIGGLVTATMLTLFILLATCGLVLRRRVHAGWRSRYAIMLSVRSAPMKKAEAE